MGPWRIPFALAGATLLLLGSSVQAGEVCDPARSGPVSLIILESPAQVYELARSVAGGVPVLASDASTVVFRDGRVITSDVQSASRQINELGWGERRIDLVASFGSRRARPARSRG